jgi:GntR family transcriptional regulator
LINIELRGKHPIYEQIVAQIKGQVIKGLLRPGDPIPSIRKLSVMAQVNPNTVARAYQELERMGVIETIIGRGTIISETQPRDRDPEKVKSLFEKLKPLFMELLFIGMNRADIMGEVDNVLQDLEGDNK